MTFIVRAKPSRPVGGEGIFEARTKKDAVEKAMGLLKHGLKDVTITDEDGRVYAAHEFDQFLLTARAEKSGLDHERLPS